MGSVKIVNGDKLVHLLRTLPKDLTSDRRGGVVAKSMRKGANLILKEAKVRLQASIDLRGDESTGLLMKNLRARRKRYKGKGELFTVGVGNRRYPVDGQFVIGKNGKKRQATLGGAKTTRLSGQRLEYGTSRQAPAPWVRPTFAKTAEPAINAITADLGQRLDKLAQAYFKG